MKSRRVLFVSLMALLFVLASTLIAKRGEGQRLKDRDPEKQGYLSTGSLHKLIISANDEKLYAELRDQGAISQEFDYGSFKMVIFNESSVGGREALARLSAPVRDDQNLILLNGHVLDTTNAQISSLALPSELRQTEMAEALAAGRAPDRGLYLIQFAGPVQDAWLDALRDTGVDVVSYIPSNAYVVRAEIPAAALLAGMRSRFSFVQYIGDYEPAYRLSPVLQKMRQAGNVPIEITVQVIDSFNSAETIDALRSMATEAAVIEDSLNYHNVRVTVPSSRLAEIARLDNVFALEERGRIVRLDEAQGQILAGNLSGNVPTGPGYLSFLASKGFSSSQFSSFAVEVVDDAYTLTGHPDLPSSRIAFQNNPSNQTGAQGGHGFLNSNIIGGFNDSTGTAFEDANGFNYGLGIAPFARLGVTAIFGSGSANATSWESVAYGQSARISSNSWGFQNAFGQPIPRYDSNAQSYDRLVRDAQSSVTGLQSMTIVFSAGNSGSGSNTVSTPGTAKNIITVGAGENARQTGTDGCGISNSGADSANDVIGFSSRGPVNSSGGDGRVKPDIMAPGTHIEAGIPQSNYNGSSVCNQYWPSGQTLYGWSSGTSHSCPAVAGGAALVYQYFLNQGFSAPSPAMVKAYLQNSATRMTGAGGNDTLPSNSQGMGRMDLGRAFDGGQRILVDQTQVFGATGQTYTVTGTVASSSQPFRVTLGWTDAPGPTTGAPWVNNLDLEVTIGGQTYKGNVFSGDTSITGGVADGKNNSESVFLPAGTSGNFTITIRATNIAGDGVPGNADTTDQDFALVVYNATAGAPPPPTIGVSPSSFTFTATEGGSNPASQTLSISNTGGGTLNWNAASNAGWLGVSPASGTAPATATVSANISGLTAGTYNGTITVSSAGATNTPVSVPVTLTINASTGGSELIVNGGFEGSSAPWVLSGQAVRTVNGSLAHTGSAYLTLGDANRATGQAYQQVTIPSTVSTSNLNFWLNITSNEGNNTNDRIFVEVRSTTGALLATLATFSNQDETVSGMYELHGPYSLLNFRGQTVRVQFRATTSNNRITTFRVDDVSLK